MSPPDYLCSWPLAEVPSNAKITRFQQIQKGRFPANSGPFSDRLKPQPGADIKKTYPILIKRLWRGHCLAQGHIRRNDPGKCHFP